MHNQKLQLGFQEAKKITKKFAKTFYLASLFLPREKKYASYTIYAICRLSDETVDNPDSLDQNKNLQELELKISRAYSEKQIDDPLLAAFSQTVNKYKIPQEYFNALLQGMHMDLEIKRYKDFSPLNEYCYRVAGVVGLIMLKIFGYKDNSAEVFAIKLGVAMQLTNILRDIKEDLARGRIYLPQDEMAKFNICEKQLLEGRIDKNFKDLLSFQIDRCRQFYDDSLQGVKLINSRFDRFVVLCMKEVYAAILKKIEENNYDIFTTRAYVSKPEKIRLILKILQERKYL
ncbi:MAG: phytoene/squalene synthase family protein [Candidatus Omnitrophica bacterium]|jgi:phytoene synthase|nr:phytoene/squalene synthase family protein [Candidatus Omnitrophota bacterium]